MEKYTMSGKVNGESIEGIIIDFANSSEGATEEILKVGATRRLGDFLRAIANKQGGTSAMAAKIQELKKGSPITLDDFLGKVEKSSTQIARETELKTMVGMIRQMGAAKMPYEQVKNLFEGKLDSLTIQNHYEEASGQRV